MSRYSSQCHPAIVPPHTILLPHLVQLLMAFALGLLMLWATAAEAGVNFANTASMALGRSYHTGIVLSSGKVLVAGGFFNNTLRNTSELYDPTTSTWSSTGNLLTYRWQHTAVRLLDGKVLIAGGKTSTGLAGTSVTSATAELFDPVTGIWSSTGSMSTARVNHTMTLLNSGRVLVTGGQNGSNISSAEIYDPATGLWSSAGNMSKIRLDHTATLLSSNKVLIVGGEGGSAPSTAEIYDPTTNTWSNTGSLSVQHNIHGAALLANGKVLIVGGAGNAFFRSSELYDPATGTWATTGNLIAGRTYVSGLTLTMPDGQVLVVGGFYSPNALASAELYNPSTGAWSAAGTLALSRYASSVNLLSNGKVLVAGGENGLGSNSTAELYTQAATLVTTSVVVSTAPNPSTAGASVLVTATVSGTTPTGTVTFTEGATILCSAVAVSSGVATCTLPVANRTVGSHNYIGSYSGDASNAASTSLSFTHLINAGSGSLANQAITFGVAPTLIVGGTGTVSATGGASGNAVSFTSSTPAICTVSGSTVTGVMAGTCTIAANQAGNGSFNAAPQVTQSFSVGSASLINQTISFGAVPTLIVGGTGTLSATATAGLAVSYTSSTPAICTVSGSTVTGVTAGICTIAANQAGNGIYNAAPTVTQSIAVGAPAVAGAPAAAIPTLSEWSMALLAGLLGLFGMGVVRQRAKTVR